MREEGRGEARGRPIRARVVVNIGDQDSDLDGGAAKRAFKLPNPMYYIPNAS
jgi:HAD superfamily, subfamily IIIB (Acid phosphatase)